MVVRAVSGNQGIPLKKMAIELQKNKEAKKRYKREARIHKKVSRTIKGTTGGFERAGEAISRYGRISVRSPMQFIQADTGIRLGPQKAKKVRVTRGKGRPSGPSGRYFIPGKGPVGVYEWRKWAAQERMLRQMQQAQQMARMPPQARAYYAQTGELPPTQQEMMAQRIHQQAMMQQQPETVASPRNDNILNAPNIMRGEMIRRPNQPEVNIAGRVTGPTADEAPRPVVNPHGDIYMDIDPMSGRPILRRRISEKWLAGRKV